jgi:hypothetical protein
MNANLSCPSSMRRQRKRGTITKIRAQTCDDNAREARPCRSESSLSTCLRTPQTSNIFTEKGNYQDPSYHLGLKIIHSTVTGVRYKFIKYPTLAMENVPMST